MSQRTCQIEGCSRVHYARGWCNMHWSRWYKNGTTADPRPSPEERFWAKVDKAGPLPKWAPFLGPCWIWTASTGRGGYGQFKLQNATSMVKTHRFAYELVKGPIPEGLELDHLCRVRACCNPAHLEPVTHRENGLRGLGPSILGARNGSKTHCKNGHEFTPENTYSRPTGGRACLACKRALNRAYMRRQRTA